MRKKICTKCEVEKSISEYYQNKNNHWCISCYREATLSNYYKNVDVFANRQRNRRRKNPELSNSYRKRHPEKYKAHSAVSNAVRDGRLEKLSACEKCGCDDKKLHGHHWQGYNKENWLNVKWLCPPCHKQSEIK